MLDILIQQTSFLEIQFEVLLCQNIGEKFFFFWEKKRRIGAIFFFFFKKEEYWGDLDLGLLKCFKQFSHRC